jgi:mono/diheme cytochrome c family protein
MKRKAWISIFILFSASLFTMSFINMTASPPEEDTGWKAPAEADKLENPFKKDADAWKNVETTYAQLCAICHGESGKGDGIAGMALTPRPANFTLDRVQKQSDGAIFWKMTNGKTPMASYKESLTEEQRWQLVKFIRHLAE